MEKVIYLRFRTTNLSLETGSHELMNNFASLVLVSDTSTMETKLFVSLCDSKLLLLVMRTYGSYGLSQKRLFTTLLLCFFFFFFFLVCVCV